ILIGYVSPSEFGIYSIAFLNIPILGYLFRSVNNAAMPIITKLYSEKKFDEVERLWVSIIKKNSSVAIPIVVYFFLMAPEIVGFFFTESFLDAVLYYRIYLLVFILSMTSYGMILRASGLTRLVLISNLIGLIITVII